MVSFMQPVSGPRRVPGSGPQDAKIVIVGEAPGTYEANQLKPFVGPAGSVLETCLHAAGLIRSEVYLTNVVKVMPKGNNIDPYFNGLRGTFSADGWKWVEELREEINGLNPNIVVACGAVASAALTGQHKILKYRGYLFDAIGLNKVKKVLPTIHPSASLRGQYTYRHLIAADLKKAKFESTFSELNRPQRNLVYRFGDVNEVLEWLRYFETADMVSFDIEVLNWPPNFNPTAR